MKAKYSRSSHYLGKEGQDYLSWQQQSGDLGGILDARTFQKGIAEKDCVIDFGCGGGFLLKNLSCSRRIGIEVNPAACVVAKQNGIECYSDLEKLPNLLADVVISNHALEHVPAPVEILVGLYNLLRSQGRIIVKVPIDDWRTQIRIKNVISIITFTLGLRSYSSTASQRLASTGKELV